MRDRAHRASGRTRPIVDARDLRRTTSRRPAVAAAARTSLGALQRRRASRPTSGTCGGPSFLDNLWIEVIDEPYENGVMGKHVIFHIEERPRVKVVDYVPAGRGRSSRSTSPRSKRRCASENVDVQPRLVRRRGDDPPVKGVIRELYAEKGYNDAVIDDRRCRAAGRAEAGAPDVHDRPGPEGQDCARSSSTATRRSATRKLRSQMKENKPQDLAARSSPTAARTRKRSSPEDAERGHGVLQEQRLRPASQVGQPQIETIEDSQGRQDALDPAARSGRRGPAGTRSASSRSPATPTIKPELVRPLFKIKEGDVLQPRRRSARASRRRRRSTARSASGSGTPDVDLAAARHRSGDGPARSAPEPPPPIMDVTIKMIEGKQFFVNRITFARQHDDARQRHPPRDARARRRRLQHRGAQGQRPPAEPARLLQAARRQGRRDRRRADAGQRRQGRHQAQVRGAEPQPALVRRRRVAVRRLLRPAVVPDVELPRPRRDARRVAAEGLAGAAVPGLVQRAVPVRPADHRRASTSSRRQYIFPLQYTQDSTGTQHRLRVPARRLHAAVHWATATSGSRSTTSTRST